MKVVESATTQGEKILRVLPETDLERNLLLDFDTEPRARRTSDADIHIVIFIIYRTNRFIYGCHYLCTVVPIITQLFQ